LQLSTLNLERDLVFPVGIADADDVV